MDLIRLDVGGLKHKVYKDTLLKFPDTFLGRLIADVNSPLAKKNKHGYYFIDRNPVLFAFVLDFYRTGRIVYPTIVEKKDFQEELKFWGLYIEDPPSKSLLHINDIVDFSKLCSIFEKYKVHHNINEIWRAEILFSRMSASIEHALVKSIRENWSIPPPEEFLSAFNIDIIETVQIPIILDNGRYLITYRDIKRYYSKVQYHLLFKGDSTTIIYYRY
jgi:hypothetical protein